LYFAWADASPAAKPNAPNTESNSGSLRFMFLLLSISQAPGGAIDVSDICYRPKK
jgi:hypothetical protein